MRPLNRNIYRLGFLSLFNDFTADMITPLLPVYLATMGVGPQFLGIMEGVANFFSYLTRLASGIYVDRYGNNKKLTWFGYGLCAVIRLLLAIPFYPLVFFVRITDRIGKGIRTTPRDGLIMALAEKKDWGRAFGVQRSMDHLGALLGAACATFLLSYFSISLSWLFLLAAIPSLLASLWIPRKIPEVPTPKSRLHGFHFSWKALPPSLKAYVGIIFFAAFTSPSELFLLMKMHDLGLKEYLMPLAWLLLTLFSLVSAYLGGLLSDRWSRRGTIGIGWVLYAIVFLVFAFNQNLILSWIFLGLFGFQAGLVEASERSYPASLASENARATALGWYYLAYGLGMLPASLIFGFLWKYWSAQNAFLLYAGLTFLSVFFVGFLPSSRGKALTTSSVTDTEEQ